MGAVVGFVVTVGTVVGATVGFGVAVGAAVGFTVATGFSVGAGVTTVASTTLPAPRYSYTFILSFPASGCCSSSENLPTTVHALPSYTCTSSSKILTCKSRKDIVLSNSSTDSSTVSKTGS